MSRRWWLKPGVMLLWLLIPAALFAPFLAPYDPTVQLETTGLLGGDNLRRDLLSRLLYGSRNAVSVAFLGSVGAVGLGLLISAIVALGSNTGRKLFNGILQAVLSIPTMIYILLGITFMEPGVSALVTLLAVTLWPETARLVQAEVESMQRADFVNAARLRGESELTILMREIAPNLKSVLGVAFLLTTINAVLMESVLSYLGLGLPLGVPSLGNLIDHGAQNMFDHAYGLHISVAVLLAWLLGLHSLLEHLRGGAELRVVKRVEKPKYANP